MTLCPVALAVGCRKCPAVTMCPLKTVIGDYRERGSDDAEPRQTQAPPKSDE